MATGCGCFYKPLAKFFFLNQRVFENRLKHKQETVVRQEKSLKFASFLNTRGKSRCCFMGLVFQLNLKSFNHP